MRLLFVTIDTPGAPVCISGQRAEIPVYILRISYLFQIVERRALFGPEAAGLSAMEAGRPARVRLDNSYLNGLYGLFRSSFGIRRP